ncbi:MAG TPA: hypothetical protein VNN25_03205 [Thermoanaerobaculia bacterium]|nr:hypothetical protein [Thermoanaerobaculia bacterium]
MSAAGCSTYKPYKGTASYQAEDAELFFGRRVDAEQLLARVLSARLTLLHAQSGAGKTSLVNATVIPGLERRGWTPVRILPHTDPMASARTATLGTVLPPPEAEVAAIDRVLSALPAASEMTISELLHVYDSLDIRDLRKRSLIAPLGASHRRSLSEWGDLVPQFCRLLRSTIDVDAFASHIAAVRQGGDAALATGNAIDGSTSLTTLRELLDSEHLAIQYKTLLAYLDPPSKRLWPFLENLIQVYGERRPRFALLLVFDQFEEMFTRFVDPGTAAVLSIADLPDWRLRYQFFEELQEVYCGRLPASTIDGQPSPGGELPSIRFLISMRSEYIAQLGSIREFAPEIDQSVFHLQLLSKEGALDAIQEPARLYGYRYGKECYERIIEDLTKEERFVEPTHLSLICEKLWDEAGCERSANASPADVDGGIPEIGLDIYETRLKGAKGILRAFLRDYLDGLRDADERTESLELLEPLITGTGTRNIVERSQLIDVPFGKTERRKRLLQGLVNRTIVRIEIRLGGDFVEITHEFLISSIQEVMQEVFFANVEYQRLRAALQALRTLGSTYAGTDIEGTLPEHSFTTLHQNREKIEWTPTATDLMFRASICYGRDRETISAWSRAFAETGGDADVLAVLSRVERGDATRDILSAEELRKLNAVRQTTDLTPKQTAFVLRSQLAHGTPASEVDIRYWSMRAKA